ncbi:hypothetical protein GGS20DRAFT_582641 [Poronia punctata]|nr:hypothetical protein GGS20DRAFT_582641 [Poronia punctata]
MSPVILAPLYKRGLLSLVRSIRSRFTQTNNHRLDTALFFRSSLKIIKHYMHHDIATPMIIDAFDPEPRIYANPLRTSRHYCELDAPPPPPPPPPHPPSTEEEEEAEDNDDITSRCAHHSCCIPRVEKIYCATTTTTTTTTVQQPPCPGYLIEHQHIHQPYFGLTRPEAEHIYGKQAIEDAEWRNLSRMSSDELDFSFAHNAKHAAAWRKMMYVEGEKLYRLDVDARALREELVLGYGRNSQAEMQRGREKVRVAEEELRKHRDWISYLYDWAEEPCTLCHPVTAV